MAQWAVTIPADQWATERLFHNDTVTLTGAADAVAPDDEVLLIADDHVVALARAAKTDGDDLVMTYVRRAFDAPVPATGLPLAAVPVEVEPEVFRRLAAALSGEPGPAAPSWLVSVALPIEAATPADAVRQFWTHMVELGPRELPTYVWPSGDELAMQAFVLGAEANQDPEEDEDD
ncbi:hypothetical protein ACQP2F_43275 [Actinoplanes sp. CA-030573]|uniref:hypothetical protein n=1 Tax=Actinoplanes sp. CA-030573 TaxID=3239898 RepID=UPI003D8F9FA4